MDLLEYQGKALFAEAGLPVLRSQLITDAAEAEPAARELGFPVAVKAQVKTGGRGKAGGGRGRGGHPRYEHPRPPRRGRARRGRRRDRARDVPRDLLLATAPRPTSHL